MAMRSFTSLDWQGWGGAEPFKNGAEPLIDDSGEVNIIADRHGIEITFADANSGDIEAVWHLFVGDLTWDPEIAQKVCAVLTPDPVVLAVFGFQKIL